MHLCHSSHPPVINSVPYARLFTEYLSSAEQCLSSSDETLLNVLNEKAFKLIGVEWMNSGPLCDLYMIPLMAQCHR